MRYDILDMSKFYNTRVTTVKDANDKKHALQLFMRANNLKKADGWTVEKICTFWQLNQYDEKDNIGKILNSFVAERSVSH